MGNSAIRRGVLYCNIHDLLYNYVIRIPLKQRGIMKDRTHDIRAFLVKELKWLRRGEGATWKRYATTRLLSSIVGGDETDYTTRLKALVAK